MVVNVTSSVALAPMPLVAVYTASKMAIEGFTGSLAHEFQAFNVCVKLVEPGYAPTTRFAQNMELRIDELTRRCKASAQLQEGQRKAVRAALLAGWPPLRWRSTLACR